MTIIDSMKQAFAEIAALKVDLNQARAERDERFAQLGCRTRERDAAVKRAEAAEAQATADVARLTARVHELQDACSEKEGEVRAAREEVARLRNELQVCETSCTAMKGAWNESLDQLRGKWQESQAARGQAVAALQHVAERAKFHQRDIGHHLDDMLAPVNAVLADPTSAQAVEAWRELVAVYEEAKRFIDRTAEIDDKHPAYGFVVMGIPLAKAVAKVDPRRGGGGRR